jgi:hypothetical protein
MLGLRVDTERRACNGNFFGWTFDGLTEEING